MILAAIAQCLPFANKLDPPRIRNSSHMYGGREYMGSGVELAARADGRVVDSPSYAQHKRILRDSLRLLSIVVLGYECI